MRLICPDVPNKDKWIRSILNIFKVIYLDSVHPRFCWRGGGGVDESTTKVSKRGLTGSPLSPFLEGGCWKWRGDFFSFYTKNKLKSEILNDKKNYKQKCLSAITKNLNWQILTTNSVTFKRWDGFKDEKF